MDHTEASTYILILFLDTFYMSGKVVIPIKYNIENVPKFCKLVSAWTGVIWTTTVWYTWITTVWSIRGTSGSGETISTHMQSFQICLTCLMCLAVIFNILLNFVYSHTPFTFLQKRVDFVGLFRMSYFRFWGFGSFSNYVWTVFGKLLTFHFIIYKKWGF